MFARRVAPAGLVAALALAAAACTAPKSKVCREVCAREAECIESRSSDESSFDESECIAACAALERDEKTKQIVDGHAACVRKAGKSCPAVLECK